MTKNIRVVLARSFEQASIAVAWQHLEVPNENVSLEVRSVYSRETSLSWLQKG